MSLSGFTIQYGLKCAGIKLQAIQDIEWVLILGNNFGGEISSIMGDSYEKSVEDKKILYINANKRHGWTMTQSLLKMTLNLKVSKAAPLASQTNWKI